MRTTTAWIVGTLALGLLVGLAAPAAAAATDPQAARAMDDCVFVDPFSCPPHVEVNPDDCHSAS